MSGVSLTLRHLGHSFGAKALEDAAQMRRLEAWIARLDAQHKTVDARPARIPLR